MVANRDLKLLQERGMFTLGTIFVVESIFDTFRSVRELLHDENLSQRDPI